MNDAPPDISCTPLASRAGDPGIWLADNVRALRESRQLSQRRLATLAGVPRATCTHLESGAANPTLLVLMKVAAALQVSVDELIAPPRAVFQVFPADALRQRTKGGVHVRKLLPAPLPGLDLERLQLAAGARMAGVPHTPGTQEYLACESGEVELVVSGEVVQLKSGEIVVFRGDQRHSYGNPGKQIAVAYSAVVRNDG
ncbi:MAG: helix-turn-helix transcriptional regulator [Myxococcales bacterium]|nr:helix-turn-helix transcriptional regulator [Myxococcales bacterium]